MTTILLVRHAAHLLPSRVLVGRTDSTGLSQEGRDQAVRLSELLAREPVAAVQASPRRRALETARIIAARHILSVEVEPDLDELDFGAWTGLSFQELENDQRWHAWNNDARASARPPQGETMLALQNRVVRHLARVQKTYPDETVILVSHAEPIRAMLLHARGLSLDEFSRIEVPPAGVTRLHLGRKYFPSPTFGNCHASGTTIIAQLGEEHLRTGKPIRHTADNVPQIAAHEEAFGLERLDKV